MKVDFPLDSHGFFNYICSTELKKILSEHDKKNPCYY